MKPTRAQLEDVLASLSDPGAALCGYSLDGDA